MTEQPHRFHATVGGSTGKYQEGNNLGKDFSFSDQNRPSPIKAPRNLEPVLEKEIVLQTPIKRKTKVVFDKNRAIVFENSSKFNVNDPSIFRRKHFDLAAPSPVSFVMDPNVSTITVNEISGSPLVSLSFYSVEGNEPMSVYRPPPRASARNDFHSKKSKRLFESENTNNTSNAYNGGQISEQQVKFEEKEQASSKTELIVSRKNGNIASLEDVRKSEPKVEIEKPAAPSKEKFKYNTEKVEIGEGKEEEKAGRRLETYQFDSLFKELRECNQKTREIELSLQKISERLSIFEVSNTGALTHNKDLTTELRNDIGNFKEKFNEEMYKKLQRTIEKLEDRLLESMEAYVHKLIEKKLSPLLEKIESKELENNNQKHSKDSSIAVSTQMQHIKTLKEHMVDREKRLDQLKQIMKSG